MNRDSTVLSTTNEKLPIRDRIMMFFIMIIPCFFMRMELDNDAYWIINSGRYVLENGIPHVEPFTFHEGLHFVMQQWLTAVSFAAIYELAGTVGLLLFIFILFVLTVVAVYKLCYLISNGNQLVSYMVAVADTLVLFLFMTTRPYPISLLIFLLEIIILERWVRNKKNIELVFLPILSLLLINFHGAMWPFLFVVALPFVIDSFQFRFLALKGEGYPKLPLFIALMCSVATGFINPYGWESMTYLFRSYGYQNISTYVSEMRPPDFQGTSGIVVLGIFFIVVVVYLFAKQPRTKLRYVLLTLGTGYLALSSVRSLSLFAICGFPFLAYALRDIKPPFTDSAVLKPRIRNLIIYTLIIISIGTFAYQIGQVKNFVDPMIPIEATGYIIEELDSPQIRLYSDYNWGGYLEFRGLKPFIDARAEVFVKANNGVRDILDDMIAMYRGELHYKEFISIYEFNVLLVKEGDLMATYLEEDNQYVLAYSDDEALVYVSKTYPLAH